MSSETKTSPALYRYECLKCDNVYMGLSCDIRCEKCGGVMVPVDKKPPKTNRVGFCAKCANAIVVREPIKKGGPTYDKFAGCKLTDDPQNGRNCPLIKEA